MINHVNINSFVLLSSEGLMSVVYNNDLDEDGNLIDIFKKKFEQWDDNSYLYDFLVQHKEHLKADFFKNKSIEKLVEQISKESIVLRKKLLQNKPQHVFKAFDNKVYRNKPYQKEKAKSGRNGILRIYAIMLEDGDYIITGGAIKLTDVVEGNIVLEKEDSQMNIVRDFLRQLGVSNCEDITIYFAELN